MTVLLPPQENQLLLAQAQAKQLFNLIGDSGLIRPGASEAELSNAIHQLAEETFGIKTYWHKRLVRAGQNTLCQFEDNPPIHTLGEDDILFIDLGPVFEEYEADFGKTYVLGSDPRKHEAQRMTEELFRKGKFFYSHLPDMTARDLYQYLSDLAREAGWEWGSPIAGHVIGVFPHKHTVASSKPFTYIRPENDRPLNTPDDNGQIPHWILEVHLVDRDRQFGAFFEDLLTLG